MTRLITDPSTFSWAAKKRSISKLGIEMVCIITNIRFQGDVHLYMSVSCKHGKSSCCTSVSFFISSMREDSIGIKREVIVTSIIFKPSNLKLHLTIKVLNGQKGVAQNIKVELICGALRDLVPFVQF